MPGAVVAHSVKNVANDRALRSLARLMPLKKILADSSWAEGGASLPRLAGLTTFAILALELALIHWTSSQVRVFAYINNIVLITAFLGMAWVWRWGGGIRGWCIWRCRWPSRKRWGWCI